MSTDSFCPHCGSANLDESYEKQTDGRKFYFVVCNECEACGPTDYDQDKALELWKQRATEPKEPAGGYSPYDEWRTGADC